MRQGARGAWIVGGIVVVLGLSLVLVVWYALRAMERAPAHAVREAGDAAAEVAARFKSGTITETFVAALPTLQAEGPLLELAALDATETFTRTDERAVFFDLIPLGKNVTEIRVPVTYRYHLRLSDPWHLDVLGPACFVRAPRIRATVPPAIHTDRLERRAERGWLRFDLEEQMAALERTITPRLSAHAESPEAIDLVRETCRRRVEDFVRTWLLRESQWGDDGFTAVTVAFEGEVSSPNTISRPMIERRGQAAGGQGGSGSP